MALNNSLKKIAKKKRGKDCTTPYSKYTNSPILLCFVRDPICSHAPVVGLAATVAWCWWASVGDFQAQQNMDFVNAQNHRCSTSPWNISGYRNFSQGSTMDKEYRRIE